jgi:outer membrane protein
VKLLSSETLKLKKNYTFEPDKNNQEITMKRTIIIIALALSIVSCNKSTQETKTMKTAFVDTSKLLEDYTEAKDIEAKYKTKSTEMGKELEAEIANFKAAAADFQKRAPSMGQVWAQENGAKLQRREQELSYAQDAMLQQLRQESGVEMDTLVKQVKKFIKDYGKEKGYDYIYGTGEAVSILYGQEKYDITKDIVKLLNDKYKAPKKEDDADVKADAKKELEAIEKKK